ncbi:cation diffusion facilitator family transporter [Patulibacter defluvii]|uniref:cation diffusion facilitator family transporter n=1 Tax=Patulibacter defluvii TaxID=3095358 RepID=UPI002A74880B|nr:cation diffusion facilitator family transporter [Patulibacter sp. DM4]
MTTPSPRPSADPPPAAAAAPGHDHADHDHDHHHGVSADDDRRWIAIALAITTTFMLIEVVTGVISGSLALLSDASHMLTDAAALALALGAAHLARRPAAGRYTFGLARAEILSGLINAVALLVLGVLIAVEGVRRLFDPPQIEAGLVIVVGVTGGLANVASAWALSRAQRRSMNVEGARLHVMMDLFGSLAAVAAGVAVVVGGWEIADPIASLIVAFLMLRGGVRLTRSTGRVLLEAAPADVEPPLVGRAIYEVEGVVGVHDLHVWELTTGFPALSGHVVVAADAEDPDGIREAVRAMLHARFSIDHATLQVERGDASGCEGCAGTLHGPTLRAG